LIKHKRTNPKPPQDVFRLARRISVFVIGGTVLALGILMIVLPGPAFIVIPIGLAILATEFLWARQLLKRLKKKIEEFKRKSISRP
jgi:uncharacterized protein (TIGR02611 family)